MLRKLADGLTGWIGRVRELLGVFGGGLILRELFVNLKLW